MAHIRYKMPLNTRRKLRLVFLIAWEMLKKRCRYVCRSQNVCPGLIYREGEWWTLCTKKNAFSHDLIQNQHFAGSDSTVRCSLVNVVLHEEWDSRTGNFTVRTLLCKRPFFKSALSPYWASSGNLRNQAKYSANPQNILVLLVIGTVFSFKTLRFCRGTKLH